MHSLVTPRVLMPHHAGVCQPVETRVLCAVSQVLCMTVECGFGGQKFQEHVLDKVRGGACSPSALRLGSSRITGVPQQASA
jgi:hypothetical protein